MNLRRTLERLRFVHAQELPYRAHQQWVHATDRWWRPPPVPPGPEPSWPGGAAPIGQGAGRKGQGAGDDADPRVAWERTRLQTADVAEAVAWLAANPPGTGLGWAVSMEVALRLVSLVRLADGGLPDARAHVHAHAAWVARHPSRGSSANNHRVAELGALALAGHALATDAWADQVAALPETLRAQLHPDGAGVEQSPTYLAYDLEWALLARRCGVAGLDEPIARAAGFLAALVDEVGEVPALGDDDDGRVVAIDAEPYVRSVVGAAGLAVGGYAGDDRVALLGSGPPVPTAIGSTCFPDGGLTVLISREGRVVVDHGPVGGAWLAAHGHADALALYVHDRHGPVVVGRGTGSYHEAAARRFHRGTAAHPTVVVDGADQSEPSDHPFLWRRRATARLEVADLPAGFVRARHDGYAGRGVVHRRTVRCADGGWVVEDELTGTGLHHVAVHWPLAPGLRAGEDGVVRRGAEVALTVAPDPSLALAVVRGGERPGLGWHAASYGGWVEADALVAAAVLRLPVVLRTVLRAEGDGGTKYHRGTEERRS